MYREPIKYGVALISGEQFRFYLVTITGKHQEIKLLKTDEIQLQKRQRKGGQSAVRIDRIRELKELHYLRRISEEMVETYLEENKTQTEIESLVVAGPGEMKDKVLQEPSFRQFLYPRLVRVLPSEEIREHSTIVEVVSKCRDLFLSSESRSAKTGLLEIRELVRSDPDRLVFGKREVREGLENRELEKIWISEDLKTEEISEWRRTVGELTRGKCLFGTLPETEYGEYLGVRFYSKKTLDYPGSNLDYSGSDLDSVPSFI